jgi:trehalose synthase
MREVEVGAIALDRLAGLLSTERAERLAEGAARGREVIAGRTIWNVNATATGAGVAEMLQALLAYTSGAGVQTRWLVLAGEATQTSSAHWSSRVTPSCCTIRRPPAPRTP